MAGLPLYIHAPKFYVDAYGLSLAGLGVVLFGLRLLDVVQDPLLGRLAAYTQRWRQEGVTLALMILALSMGGLLAVTPPVDPMIWFALMLLLVFSSYSFLNICFYAQGVAKGDALGRSGHLRVARWREAGALLGVCFAAVLPTVLALGMAQPFVGFAAVFALVTLVSGLLMRPEWRSGNIQQTSGFGVVLGDPLARRLLMIGFVNAVPVAVSSTLFLFFVESRIEASGLEGVLLLLFFLSAAVAAPLWAKLAERAGGKKTLLWGMVLSVLAFGCALMLGAGDVLGFALVCVASGAALGADMTLLPAIFAQRLSQIAPSANEGFGLWSFVTKFSLAFSAVTLLPLLERAGFESGAPNTSEALWLLSLLYAGVPCALKVIAILLLYVTPVKEVRDD